jgi:hypothetical protein
MKKNINIVIILIIVFLLLVFLYLYNKKNESFEDGSDYHFGILNIKKSLFPSYPRNEEGLIHTSLNVDYYFKNHYSEFQEVIANIFKLNKEEYKDNEIIVVNKEFMDYLHKKLTNSQSSIVGKIYRFNEDIKLSNTNETLMGLVLCKFAYIYYNNSTDSITTNYKNNTLTEDGKTITTDNYDAKYSKFKAVHFILSNLYNELVKYKGGYGCGNKYINGFNSVNYENKNGGDYLSILIVIKNKSDTDIFDYLEEIKRTYNYDDNININFTYGNIKDTNTYKTDILEKYRLYYKWTEYKDNKPILVNIPKYIISRNINKSNYAGLHIDATKASEITTTTEAITTTTEAITTTTEATTTTQPITTTTQPITTTTLAIGEIPFKKIDKGTLLPEAFNNELINDNITINSLKLISDSHYI